jgi:hypothetical protein
MWTAEELEAVVSEARIRGLPVHAYAERPADVVRGAAAQFDGFLGTNMGTTAFPPEVMQAITGRLTQAGARPIAWTPAISALLNLESLKVNDEPLDDPGTELLPELVAADIKIAAASARVGIRRCAGAPTSCASSTGEVLLLLGSGAGEPGHLHRARPGKRSFWVRVQPARREKCGTTCTATAMA